MDLSAVLSSFNTGTYSVARATTVSAGSDGRAQAPSRSTVSIQASVQPLGGRDLQRLPEGFRTKQMVWIFTSTELKTTGSGYEADVVIIDGASWEVQSVMPYSVLGNYYQCAAMRVGH